MIKPSVLAIGAALFLATACTTTKYTFHSVAELSGCRPGLSRGAVAEASVDHGYLKAADPQGPLEIFWKPKVYKKSAFSQEPYGDRGGEFGVAVCAQSDGRAVLAMEEWRGCRDQKDCTQEDQADLAKLIASRWGCQVQQRAGHSETWKLESRQDWTTAGCEKIVRELAF